MKPARLSFFNEQDASELAALLADGDVVRQVSALGARVTMGLKDVSASRADSVRRLEGGGVPVDGWLLLPREAGYFATQDNLEAVRARVDEVRRWVDAERLPLRTLGLDFEPDLRELDALFARPVRTVAGWVARGRRRERHRRAREGYRALVSELRADGWRVESYQFPLLVEDRRAGSDWFQRVVGALDVPVDREVWMAYSSLLGPLGPGLVASWAAEGRAVGVGSTGGGVDPLPKLDFEALARDLRVVSACCADVAVFSLEGCVAHGHLPRLLEFDWDAPARVSPVQRYGAQAVRVLARRVAWLGR